MRCVALIVAIASARLPGTRVVHGVGRGVGATARGVGRGVRVTARAPLLVGRGATRATGYVGRRTQRAVVRDGVVLLDARRGNTI